MNKKAIKSILRKKFNSWIETIEDEKVKELVKKNTLITGGCITSMLLNEDVKDFDVYFKNKETTKAVAHYYVNQFKKERDHVNAIVIDSGNINSDKVKEMFAGDDDPEMPYYLQSLDEDRITVYIQSSGVAGELETEEPTDDIYDNLKEDEEQKKYRPVWLSPNAITLSDKIQLVIRFYGDAEEIHSNYDFVHTTNSWDSKTGELTLRQEALEAILAKELVYQGSKYPICSIIRTRKFMHRGWFINAGQYLKMIMQIGDLDLTDIRVLQDQLVGVDSAYFNALIEQLAKKQDQDSDFKITSNYVVSIIDKIF